MNEANSNFGDTKSIECLVFYTQFSYNDGEDSGNILFIIERPDDLDNIIDLFIGDFNVHRQ